MNNLTKHFLRSLLCLALVVPAFTSCYDDSEIWDKVGELENRIYELEVEMTSQVEAMNALLTNGATLTACKKNSDGSYTITLSNGTKFTVLPEGTDFSTLVSYQVVDGKKCWATFDALGNHVLITDASGNAIPVSADISVKIKNGMYVLVINGTEYETGYDAEDVVQVFSSCTPLTDASGNVYAVKFTLGDGMEITVALDGYKGVIFKLSNVNSAVVSDYYIPYGSTQSFLMDVQGVVDYVMQVPDGWRVKEVTEDLTGETYAYVTAPSESTIALGAAEAEGYIKVVSVVEGGKASVSKMYVSTNPFRKLNVSSFRAAVQPYTGVQKFAYGVMTASSFDQATVVETVNEILSSSSSDLPEGYNVSEVAIDRTLPEIYGAELSVSESYVFWVLPAMYSESGADAGFHAEAEMLQVKSLVPVSVNLNVANETVFDADVKVNVTGADAVYAGLVEVNESFLDELVYQVSNGVYEAVKGAYSYDGPASKFPTAATAKILDPGVEYAVWVIPASEGKTTYTASDVVYKTFSTKAVTAGGTLKASVADFAVTVSSISTTVSCEGAAMIYYAFLSGDDGKRYSTASNETKMSKILANATCVESRTSSVEASVKGLGPKKTKWLYAVAVGNDGLYGDVICKEATTEKVSFNSLSISLESLGVTANKAQFQVNVADGMTASDYIYWCGYEKDEFWIGEEYCGGDRNGAQDYMAANPDAAQIQKVMSANGPISEDGTITITGLSMSTNYVFIVLAKDEEGKYSKAAYKKFTTLAANLGDLVEEGTDKWNDAFSKINITWFEKSFRSAENSNMSANYAFQISCPTDLTAFVICASDTYFDGLGLASVDERIVYIENYASRRYDNGYTPMDANGNLMSEPDYYKNGELREGQLMNVYEFHVHGLPSLGFASYFAQGDHEGKCIYEEDGGCSIYDYALERIAYYNTMAPYENKAQMFGLKGDEATAWAEALYEAYKPFYENAEPIINYNEGEPLVISNPYAMGIHPETGEVSDRVIVVFRDLQGNYYAPMTIEVPNYFE